MEKKEAQDLLRRYRLGLCTEAERDIVERWYRSFDHSGDLVSHEEEHLDDLKAEMHADMTARIDHAERFTRGLEPKSSMPFLAHLRRIAAVILVGTGVGIFLYVQNDGSSIAPSLSEIPEVSRIDVRDKAMTANTESTVYLSDGSVVWLEEGSRLNYPQIFGDGPREVWLTGGASFDVSKDAERPFIVYADHLTTRVLGTRFNIRAYRDDDNQEVAVSSGRVVVSVNNPVPDAVNEMILKPNQKVVYSKKSSKLVEFRTMESIPFEKRIMAFDETRLEDIIKVMNAYYGVNISISTPKMNNCAITADLSDETLEMGLAILASAMKATYTVEGKSIVLVGQGCETYP